MPSDLVSYYNERAKEYERIYSKPERQDDLFNATLILQKIFANKVVLEIACGTGYWTERIAQSATSIFATDINESVLEIAKQKAYPYCKVEFGISDIYNCNINHKFESLFAGFIWSHIYLEKLDNFIDTVNDLVAPGGTVVFMDNNFIEGSNTPIINVDEDGNTFQTRTLEDGTTHLILKNFPTEDFLIQKLIAKVENIKFINLKYYWILTYTIPT